MGSESLKFIIAKSCKKIAKSFQELLPPEVDFAEQPKEKTLAPDWKTVKPHCLTAKYLKAIGDQKIENIRSAVDVNFAWLSKLMIILVSMRLSNSDMSKKVTGGFYVGQELPKSAIKPPTDIQWGESVSEILPYILQKLTSDVRAHFERMGFVDRTFAVKVEIGEQDKLRDIDDREMYPEAKQSQKTDKFLHHLWVGFAFPPQRSR